MYFVCNLIQFQHNTRAQLSTKNKMQRGNKIEVKQLVLQNKRGAENITKTGFNWKTSFNIITLTRILVLCFSFIPCK